MKKVYIGYRVRFIPKLASRNERNELRWDGDDDYAEYMVSTKGSVFPLKKANSIVKKMKKDYPGYTIKTIKVFRYVK